MRILPTVSGPSGPRFVRRAGTAAPLLLRGMERDPPATGDRIEGGGAAEGEGGIDPLRYLLEKRGHPGFLPGGEPHRGASILLSDQGVGTDSVAARAVDLPGAWGIRVVIAPRFGPAFFSEALRQRILLVPLTETQIEAVAGWVEANPQVEMVVDLEAQRVEIPGREPIAFRTHPQLRDRLFYGLDDLDELRRHRDEAAAFRKEYLDRRPWLHPRGGEAG